MNPSFYAIIPASVRYNQNLIPNSKLLYGEITALADPCGDCYESISEFASLYGVSENTIKNWINNLEKAGFVETRKKENGTSYIHINEA